MPEQKVFRLPSKGAGYTALSEHNEPIPSPQAHEVLIKVHATTLNYRDLAITTGAYPFPVKDNVVPLSDAAGMVEQVGEACRNTGLDKGDKVIVNFDITNLYGPQKNWENGLGGPIDGVLRQYISVPASAVVKIPSSSSLSWNHLASLVCTGTTAWNALYGLPGSGLKPGQTILFQGTGGVSMTGLILAKAAGATTIVTSSSDEKLKMVKDKFGADYTINYKTHSNWAEKANEITNGEGVDFVIENGGAGTIEQSIACIKPGGIIPVIGFLARPKEMPDVASLALGKGCVVRGINVGAKQLLEDLVKFVSERGLEIPVEKTFTGFSKEVIVDAFKHLEGATHVGKVCIQVA